MAAGNKVVVISRHNRIVEHFLIRIRDENRQKHKPEFRQTLEILGRFIGYEIAKMLDYQVVDVRTPLGIATMHRLNENLVIIGVLRAAIPFQEGISKVLQEASLGFIASYRRYSPDHLSFVAETSYVSIPEVTGTTVILADPMIATGSCILDALNHVLKAGVPSKVIIAGVIASEQAIERLSGINDISNIFVCAVDPEINQQGYIVPGLGDAGDLAFGSKK